MSRLQVERWQGVKGGSQLAATVPWEPRLVARSLFLYVMPEDLMHGMWRWEF
jgi:hypothetical protein